MSFSPSYTKLAHLTHLKSQWMHCHGAKNRLLPLCTHTVHILEIHGFPSRGNRQHTEIWISGQPLPYSLSINWFVVILTTVLTISKAPPPPPHPPVGYSCAFLKEEMIKVTPCSQYCIHIRVGRIDDINQLSHTCPGSIWHTFPMLSLKWC